MTFVRVTADENFPLVKFATASGRWELGLSPALFGVRVRAGVPAEQFLAIDYCAGADFIFQMRVLECVLNILSSLPETVRASEVKSFMPSHARTPIDGQPCWRRLQKMEAAALRRRPASGQQARARQPVE